MELIPDLVKTSPSKIVLVVIDGLGGLPDPETGKTEMETASTPNLDALAMTSICGFAEPVGPGITPGSAPGHLALFGYDPVKCNIGRGVLEAVGIDLDLQAGDVAARGNFCTVDEAGRVADRRAGRISTEKAAELCRLLDDRSIDGVQALVRPVREHRLVVVFRGEGLAQDVTDSDPQQEGVSPREVKPVTAEASKLARTVNRFLEQARETLSGHHPANMVLLRGFSGHPNLPTMQELYKLHPAAVAVYPMYRGLARLVGMDVLAAGNTLQDELDSLKRHFGDYDFFFLHIKWADSAGEDGDFARKVEVLEQVDSVLPQLIALGPDVLVITGDHSTPAVLKGHSWHPVPVMLHSKYCGVDTATAFSERACLSGGLGRIQASQLMALALANALKLNKFGA